MKRQIYIENDVFWEDIHAISNKKAAANYFEIVTKRTARQVINPFRCCLNEARLMGKTYDFANCLNWQTHFRRISVNRDAFFSDAAHILYSHLPLHDRFIRPASSFKEFTGQVFNYDKFKTELDFLHQNKNIAARELLCVVAPPQKIEKEYRCIFVSKELVGWSQYMENGECFLNSETPKEIKEFACEVAADPFLLNTFELVVDVAKVAGQIEPKLVELNGFETSSFYLADLDAIYKKLAEVYQPEPEYYQ